jgi:phosphatidylserine/phosphatidylglycerophosphate/cardiolipin synthase-like enzyme
MMARPELDLALLFKEIGLSPDTFGELLLNRDCMQLRNTRGLDPRISKEHWESLIAAAEASGAIEEIPDKKPPEKRRWIVSTETVNTMIRDTNLIMNVLPDVKKLYSSGNKYRIAATIPDKYQELQEFFRLFENTVLGLRRFIAQASNEIMIMVPFIDSEGLSEILSSLERALERGVKLSFLTRDLGEGGRNLEVLSGLVETAKRACGNLALYEAVMPDSYSISHAKVFSRDQGEEVYIGSANLTAASMEKTIEIGVFLEGKETKSMAEFLSVVKSISQRRWP